MMTQIKTPEEIAAMRESGKMLAQVLATVAKAIQPRMSTKDLSELAKHELRLLGGQPTFLGYQGFPDVLCVSVNDEVVHGIPRPKKIIQEGDLVSIDFGVTYQGMITDAARTISVGEISPKAKQLMEVTEKSLKAGMRVVKDGVCVGDISAAVQAVLERSRYGIVRDLVGHGVGHQLHEDPNIPNYGRQGSGMALQAGMTIAIEPMATLGDYHVVTDGDGWTIRTRDGSLAAHFEDTILVTSNGAEILTALPKENITTS